MRNNSDDVQHKYIDLFPINISRIHEGNKHIELGNNKCIFNYWAFTHIVSLFQIQYMALSASISSVVMVGLFLFVIFEVFPAKVEVIAGIFEANMIFGSFISCLLLRRII